MEKSDSLRQLQWAISSELEVESLHNEVEARSAETDRNPVAGVLLWMDKSISHQMESMVETVTFVGSYVGITFGPIGGEIRYLTCSHAQNLGWHGSQREARAAQKLCGSFLDAAVWSEAPLTGVVEHLDGREELKWTSPTRNS